MKHSKSDDCTLTTFMFTTSVLLSAISSSMVMPLCLSRQSLAEIRLVMFLMDSWVASSVRARRREGVLCWGSMFADPPLTVELARLAGPLPPLADDASWGISPRP